MHNVGGLGEAAASGAPLRRRRRRQQRQPSIIGGGGSSVFAFVAVIAAAATGAINNSLVSPTTSDDGSSSTATTPLALGLAEAAVFDRNANEADPRRRYDYANAGFAAAAAANYDAYYDVAESAAEQEEQTEVTMPASALPTTTTTTTIAGVAVLPPFAPAAPPPPLWPQRLGHHHRRRRRLSRRRRMKRALIYETDANITNGYLLVYALFNDATRRRYSVKVIVDANFTPNPTGIYTVPLNQATMLNQLVGQLDEVTDAMALDVEEPHPHIENAHFEQIPADVYHPERMLEHTVIKKETTYQFAYVRPDIKNEWTAGHTVHLYHYARIVWGDPEHNPPRVPDNQGEVWIEWSKDEPHKHAGSVELGQLFAPQTVDDWSSAWLEEVHLVGANAHVRHVQPLRTECRYQLVVERRRVSDNAKIIKNVRIYADSGHVDELDEHSQPKQSVGFVLNRDVNNFKWRPTPYDVDAFRGHLEIRLHYRLFARATRQKFFDVEVDRYGAERNVSVTVAKDDPDGVTTTPYNSRELEEVLLGVLGYVIDQPEKSVFYRFTADCEANGLGRDVELRYAYTRDGFSTRNATPPHRFEIIDSDPTARTNATRPSKKRPRPKPDDPPSTDDDDDDEDAHKTKRRQGTSNNNNYWLGLLILFLLMLGGAG